MSCNKLKKKKKRVREKRKQESIASICVYIERTSTDIVFEKIIFNKSIISSRSSVSIMFSLRETALQQQ